jgi:DUF4097 and DUF4098 domain-containing protein YvlB
MPRQRFATWSGAVLGTLCALLFAVQANAWPGRLTEEFHHTYPLPANGRIELENINGPVHITAWDQNEVKVDAVKYANTKERLDEAKIEVDAESDFVSIRTQYPDHNNTFDGGWNDPAGVEYTVTVPRTARLDEISLVNGSLDIHGVAGEVRASCVNGKLTAQDLRGRMELSTVNGKLDAQLPQLGDDSIRLSSVNGGLEVTLPSDANARIDASTVSGGIDDDFGLHVNHHQWVGHDLRAELGNGRTRIELSNVNGHIDIHRADDGKSASPVKDLGGSDKDDDEI